MKNLIKAAKVALAQMNLALANEHATGFKTGVTYKACENLRKSIERAENAEGEIAIRRYAELDAKAAFDLETFRHQRNADMGGAVRDHLKGETPATCGYCGDTKHTLAGDSCPKFDKENNR